jgi:hypothetical protein
MSLKSYWGALLFFIFVVIFVYVDLAKGAVAQAFGFAASGIFALTTFVPTLTQTSRVYKLVTGAACGLAVVSIALLIFGRS